MSKFLKLMSILAIVALIAVPAFAEVQNVKVSGDIDSKMITRNNYDLGVAATNDDDTWFMSTTRVQVDADLTDNVSTCVRLLNERDWNQEPVTSANTAGNTNIALDLSYVKLKEVFYAPLTVTIGRQNLRFGNGLVVGDPDTNSTSINSASLKAKDLSARKSFDAIRATLDYNPLTVDLIFAKINAGVIGSQKNNDDTNLWGINTAYKFNQYNSEAEAYIISKVNRGADVVPAQYTDTVNVYGVRGSLEPISKLVIGGELAMQDGDYVNAAFNKQIDRSAWAADLNAAYAIDYKWSPKVALKYSYRSGAKNTGAIGGTDVDALNTDSEYKAWDPMYEDQTPGIIANYIFDGVNDGVVSNGQTINLMASVVPVKDLTVAVDYYRYLLVQEWYSTGDATHLRTLNGTPYRVENKKDLGQEVDLSLGYDYTEDVKLGLTAGFFLPGDAFQRANDSMASTVVADVKVNF